MLNENFVLLYSALVEWNVEALFDLLYLLYCSNMHNIFMKKENSFIKS